MFPTWGIFVMIRLGLWIILGERSQRPRASFHDIMSKAHTVNVTVAAGIDLDHLAEVVFVSLVQCKVTFPPLPIPSSLERSHQAQPTLRGWGVECALHVELEKKGPWE